jgi:hypothetical protein
MHDVRLERLEFRAQSRRARDGDVDVVHARYLHGSQAVNGDTFEVAMREGIRRDDQALMAPVTQRPSHMGHGVRDTIRPREERFRRDRNPHRIIASHPHEQPTVST